MKIKMKPIMEAFDREYQKEPEESALDRSIRAIAPLIAKQVQGEWLPIETAPKDGTFIDLWNWHGGGHREPNAYWAAGVKRTTIAERSEGWSLIGGLLASPEAFTHWRPLPPPPGAEPIEIEE